MILAHVVEGGAGPAPPWLLSYIGAFGLVVVAVWLRATWLTPRLAPPPQSDDRPVPVGPLNAIGVALLILAVVAAIAGPDSAAANVAPVAVLVIWWVGLPVVCLLAGDVMRSINPFTPLVPARGGAGRPAPSWTGSAFLFAFVWFWMAYHRPGSPRSLAVFLGVYVVAALVGGWLWGRRWLATGEGFGALSAAVATVSPRRRSAAVPPGLAPLMAVWLGSSLFDAVSSTPFWQDVLGTSLGWSRTLLNTVGLVWMISVVAGVYLVVTRIAGGDAEKRETPLATSLAVALVPLALGWFIAHDLTLVLFEGQNFIALASDPIGRGWDLFGTINHTIDFRIVQAGWVVTTQLAALVLGHAAALVLAHDTALRQLRPNVAIKVTWAMTVATGAAVVGAALLVIG